MQSKTMGNIERNYNMDLNSSFYNETLLSDVNDTIPLDILSQPNIPVIIVYSALFVVAAVGNLTVFISLFRTRHRKSRISLMIRNLAIADLIVTFVMIPIEVSWRLTGRWIAGNVACKVFLFLRAFGPYLSSNVLVCVSLDRYFAVLHPLRVNDARRRGKIMLVVAWGTAVIYCIPQSFVFKVMPHPKSPQYTQCVSFGFFTSNTQEILYNLLCVMFMYFIPLFVIIIAYTAIMCEISKNSKGTHGATYRTSNGRLRLRRSASSKFERDRCRTLRMTITIVAVYVWCCTPYVIITLWYMFDRESAERLPEWLQDTFFMMVVSNSCMNPIVYGSYVITRRSNNYSRYCSCLGGCGNQTQLNNGDKQLAAGQRTQIARRVIKCFLGLKKVGSGATRSSAMGNAITRSPVDKSPRKMTGVVVKGVGSSNERPPSVGQIIFRDHPSNRTSCRTSFHSEPSTNPHPFLEQQTLGILSTGSASSQPNMPSLCCGNIKLNINSTEVYYNCDYSDRTRTRNI